MEDIDHAIRDLRNYIFGLRPGILADRQLDQAIKEMASDFAARSGVVTVVDVDADAASGLTSRAATSCSSSAKRSPMSAGTGPRPPVASPSTETPPAW